jgi:hypothetical protein
MILQVACKAHIRGSKGIGARKIHLSRQKDAIAIARERQDRNVLIEIRRSLEIL